MGIKILGVCIECLRIKSVPMKFVGAVGIIFVVLLLGFLAVKIF